MSLGARMANTTPIETGRTWFSTVILPLVIAAGGLITIYVQVVQTLTQISTQHLAIMSRLEKLETSANDLTIKLVRTEGSIEKIADLQETLRALLDRLGDEPPRRPSYSNGRERPTWNAPTK